MNAAAPGRLLLLGEAAAALAPRLALSGYADATADDASGGDPEAPPDAVVLSPGEEGRIPELRSRWGAVPLLLGIERDSVEGRCHCLRSGADDFWLTGLGPSDLLTRLRLHLGRSRPAAVTAAPDPLLRLGDMQVNPRTRAVRRGRREVTLTAREFELLTLLLRHRDTVVSREQILREIWNDQPTAASNVIEVYVRYLRRKLEEGGERRLLHTVRGRGYCLAERLPLRQNGEEAT